MKFSDLVPGVRDADVSVVCRYCWVESSLIQAAREPLDDGAIYRCKGCRQVVVLIRPGTGEEYPEFFRPYTTVDGAEVWASTTLRIRPIGKAAEVRVITAAPPLAPAEP